MERWLKELINSGIDTDKIANRQFAEVIKLIGAEAAIILYDDFHGTGFYIGTEYRRDLELQYLRKFSAGKTVNELARILKISKSKVSDLMNETPEEPGKKTNREYIPMFPDYKEKE